MPRMYIDHPVRRYVQLQAASACEEIGIRGGDTIAQRGLCAPAQCCELADVQQLLRSSVRARGIERQRSGIADDVGDELCEFGDGRVLPGPDIQKPVPRIVLQDEYAGVGEVVDGEKLAPGPSASP